MGQEKKMNAAQAPPCEMITTPQALSDLVARIRGCEMVAIDLEADSMFHFQEKVCLIQMAAGGYTAVIDPLTVEDLSSLKPLCQDPAVCKVLHGADYDVRSLYRDFGITINNLFDTQLASMYLGYKETGLESVVSHRFGVDLDKKYQKKDWSRRPLPDEMIAYAACDVVFLVPLAKMIMKELQTKKRLAWVLEECDLLSRVRPINNNGAPMFLKVKGAGRLTPRQLATLESLLQVRKNIAIQKDRPLFKIISNVTLLKLATHAPMTMATLKKSELLSDKQISMYGKSILKAIQEAGVIPQENLPAYPRRKSPRMSPRVPGRVKAIREWRDRMAERMKMDPALLLNRALIRDIAVQKPTSVETLADVPGIHHWQVEAFGAKITEIISRQK